MTNTDKKASKLNSNSVLEPLERWFSDDSTWDQEWRDNSTSWYQFYHGAQWTSEEQSALRDRGQAVITFNHIKPAIDSIIGSERQNRPKITMAGRTLDDQQIAQVKTSLYDYIQYSSNTDDELDSVVKDAFVAGRGWMYVYPELDGSEFIDLRHSHVDYRDMFIDAMSKKDDMSDCRRIHRAVFTDEDIVKQSFPKYREHTSSDSDYFISSSEENMWYEKGDRTRPRLINSWYRDENGAITTVIWVRGQILYFKKEPYTLDKFPFVQYTIERDINNTPYGLVKNMVDAQTEVNKRHSKALHYLNAKQVLAEENAFVDWNEAKKTLAKPDGITKLQDGALAEGRVQVIDNTPLAGSHIQLLELAKSEILGVAGINGAFVGQSSQYESAKKANMSIAASQTTLVPLLNKLRIARYDIADITMKLVPDFYTDEKMIRVIEPNGAYAFMPVNNTVLLDDNTLAKKNDLTNQDVDIMIEDAPKSLNEREEQFAQLLQIQGQTANPVPMDVLLRYSALKDKHQLADDIKAQNDLQAQLQQAGGYIEQLQQQIQQLGGQVQQQQSVIVQTQTARAVDKEVAKAKEGMGL
jgi:hypothetical protein